MPSLNWALKRTWLLDCIGSLIGSWALNQSLLYVYNRNNREVHCKSLFGNNYFIIVVIIKELLVVIIKKLNSWLKLLISVPRSLKMVVWYISQWLVFGLGTKTVNLAIVFLVLRTFLWNYFEKCLFSDTITLRGVRRGRGRVGVVINIIRRTFKRKFKHKANTFLWTIKALCINIVALNKSKW